MEMEITMENKEAITNKSNFKHVNKISLSSVYEWQIK